MRPSSSPRGRGQSILVSRPGPVVHELCSRLDNLPLALELAAARVTVLSPEQLLDRLSKRLDLLKAGRGVDPRQQTLRATIAWSYDLLDEEERLLFEGLSVFRGGCTLEAAEEVCDADIDTLQSLIDKSLLRRQGERFWMLETIREYATERLEERGEEDELRRRHADYFLSRAEDAAVGGPSALAEVGGRLQRRARQHPARSWRLIASGDVEREARLAVAAFWALWTQASLRELKAWLVSALDRSADLDPGLRADALGAAALAAANLGESEVAREYARESLEIARERNDKRQIEWALRVLSFDEPDLDERRRLLHECEALLRELGDDAGLGWVTFLLGVTLLDEGRLDEAREALNRAVAIFTGLGRRWEAANAENAIAYVLIADGQHRGRATDSRRGAPEGSRTPVRGAGHRSACRARVRSRANRSWRGGATALGGRDDCRRERATARHELRASLCGQGCRGGPPAARRRLRWGVESRRVS